MDTNILPKKNFFAHAAIAVAIVFGVSYSIKAHNIKGINYPTLATARITSPNATVTDFPVPIFDTGLSVACFKVRNTSPSGAIITAVGLDLPGTFDDFTLVAPTNSIFQVESQVDLGPFYPDRALDFAFLTGPRFNSGGRMGLEPSTQFTTMCVSGSFPAGMTIENMLNYVFVRFTNIGPIRGQQDIGIWENAPLP
jgi:hypothetical protein